MKFELQRIKKAIENIYFTREEKKRLGAWVKAKNIRIDEKAQKVVADVTMCNGKRTDEYKGQEYSFKELKIETEKVKFEVEVTKKDLKELNELLADQDSAADDDDYVEILRELFYVEVCGPKEFDIRATVKIKRIE